MQQLLHLLIVDPARREACVTWHGRHWLLPILRCDERARATCSISRWMAEQGVAADVIGQWLGRLSPDGNSIEWLVVVRASREASAQSPLCWAALESLQSSPPVVQYQSWAVERVTSGPTLPSVPGPFGTLTWMDDVCTWACGALATTSIGAVTPLRACAHEAVLALRTDRGPVYFKGLAPERGLEARTTDALSCLEPESFARTLATETRPDGSMWWLTAACPGQSLNEDLTGERAGLVAAACARIQQRVGTDSQAAGMLPHIDIASAVEWALELLKWAGPRDTGNVSGKAIEAARDEVTRAGVPLSWIAMDLDPGNVLVDHDGGVRFIDLDDSFLGPAPLALATFARRIARAAGMKPGPMYREYERAWSPALTGIGWAGFEIVSAVLEAHLGWKRVVLNTERGEVSGVLEVARSTVAQRLARDVSAAHLSIVQSKR